MNTKYLYRYPYQREARQREEERGLTYMALLAGAYTDIWLEKEDLVTSQLRCPGKMFRQGKLKCPFLVIAYSAL
jgi:hypothetical protein